MLLGVDLCNLLRFKRVFLAQVACYQDTKYLLLHLRLPSQLWNEIKYSVDGGYPFYNHGNEVCRIRLEVQDLGQDGFTIIYEYSVYKFAYQFPWCLESMRVVFVVWFSQAKF